jgi:hypothetical protein
MSRYCVVVALIVAALLVGCGGGTAAPKTTPTTSGAAGSGLLSASSSVIDFGSIPVGSSSARTQTLTATTSAVTVTSASCNGQGYSVTGITFPVTVAAGETVPFTVAFAPQVLGVAPGSISFVSSASNSPTATTLKGSGTQIQTAGHSVTLSWGPSPSPVIGYNVYRGTTSGGPYLTKLTPSLQAATTMIDNTVMTSTTYYYVATSVDQSNVESIYSNQFTAAVP